MAGTLTPDATGNFVRAGDLNGYPLWTRTDGQWSLWTDAMGFAFFLTPQPGIEPPWPDPYWLSDQDPATFPWIMDPQQDAIGTATATFPDT